MSDLQSLDTNTATLLGPSAEEVTRRFADHDCATLPYHNLAHTEDVVGAAELIAQVEQFGPEEREDLVLAAWWHDVGMLTTPGRGHEQDSVEELTAFLRAQGVPAERIARIARLVLATRLAHDPADPLERAIRDADLSSLGRPDYRKRLDRLREEWQDRPDSRRDLSDEVAWLEENIAFLKGHTYLTAAGERLFGEQKEANLETLERRLTKRLKKRRKKKAKAKAKGSKTAIQSEKSAQMMLKTTLRNNIDLTSIADGKANIMLSISAMIISIGMPVLAAYIPQFTYLVFPAGVLLLTCVLTIVFATLATRPVETSGVTALDSLHDGKSNLFFFGNYYRMPIDKYKTGMKEVLATQELLDSSVLNDMYYLGVALGQKFNRLRVCYGIFLIGMVLSALAFVLAFYFSGPLSEAQIMPDTIMLPPGVDSLRR